MKEWHYLLTMIIVLMWGLVVGYTMISPYNFLYQPAGLVIAYFLMKVLYHKEITKKKKGSVDIWKEE